MLSRLLVFAAVVSQLTGTSPGVSTHHAGAGEGPMLPAEGASAQVKSSGAPSFRSWADPVPGGVWPSPLDSRVLEAPWGRSAHGWYGCYQTGAPDGPTKA